MGLHPISDRHLHIDNRHVIASSLAWTSTRVAGRVPGVTRKKGADVRDIGALTLHR